VIDRTTIYPTVTQVTSTETVIEEDQLVPELEKEPPTVVNRGDQPTISFDIFKRFAAAVSGLFWDGTLPSPESLSNPKRQNLMTVFWWIINPNGTGTLTEYGHLMPVVPTSSISTLGAMASNGPKSKMDGSSIDLGISSASAILLSRLADHPALSRPTALQTRHPQFIGIPGQSKPLNYTFSEEEDRKSRNEQMNQNWRGGNDAGAVDALGRGGEGIDHF
jgi:hypothetical protein